MVLTSRTRQHKVGGWHILEQSEDNEFKCISCLNNWVRTPGFSCNSCKTAECEVCGASDKSLIINEIAYADNSNGVMQFIGMCLDCDNRLCNQCNRITTTGTNKDGLCSSCAYDSAYSKRCAMCNEPAKAGSYESAIADIEPLCEYHLALFHNRTCTDCEMPLSYQEEVDAFGRCKFCQP